MTTYYHIVADYEICGKIRTCLVYGGGTNKERAEKTVERIINNPTANDIHALGKGKNVRVEADNDEPWWFSGTN